MDRAEAAGVGVSVLGHAALLAVAWFVVNRPSPLPTAPRSFEVSYVDEVGLTAASPNPTITAMASVAPEIAPPEQAAPAPAPEPVPEPTPAAPRAAPRPAPSVERAAPPARPAPRPNRGEGTAPAQRNTGSRLGAEILRGIGNDRNARSNSPPAPAFGAEARASLNQALLRALAPCERQPLPAPEASAIRVRVAVALDPEGNLVSARVVGTSNADGELARYAERMRDLALAVVRRCTPIRGLPAEYYGVPGGWRSFNYTFPRRT